MTRLQANCILLVTAMIWGSGFVVQQVGTGELGTAGFTGIRFLIGAAVVFPLAFRQYRAARRAGAVLHLSDWLAMALVGLVLFTAAALQQYGIFHTTITNSGFLTGLNVPMVALLGLFFFHKQVHFSVWPASLCCLLGIWLLSGAQQVTLVKGDLWVIASALFWAFHVILVGMMAQRTGMPLVVAVVQFAVCGLVGLFAGIMLEGAECSHFLGAWKGICYSGILSVGVAFTLQVVGQRYTPAPDAAILLSSESVFASLGGIIFLGERLSLEQFSGAVLIFLSILAVELLPMTRGRARALERKENADSR